MATKIYDVESVSLVDGTIIRITPLKIAYLREFMDKFENISKAKNSEESISYLLKCALVAMKQYYSEIKTIEDLEDNFDLPTIYKVVNVAAGISTKKDDAESKNESKSDATTWSNLDLAKLEAEVFLLGIWKDYEELELSLSMPELTATLEIKREMDYSEKKFFAAINDVVALQGVNAQKAGFGIGMGLDYVDLTKK